MKTIYAIKREAGNAEFITIGEYGEVYASKYNRLPLDSKWRNTFESKVFVNGYKINYNNVWLAGDLHRLGDLSYAKPKAKFTVDIIEVDFITMNMTTIESWALDISSDINDPRAEVTRIY